MIYLKMPNSRPIEAAKGKYIIDNGLAGGYYRGILLDSVRKATGMA
jgi:predicted butyrate kinase (DUF1464 family)